MRILLGFPVQAEHISRIEKVALDHEVAVAQQEDLPHLLNETDVFCGHVKVQVDWEKIVARGRLRWIQSSAAGLDHCLHSAVIGSDILVSSASGVLADQVAEHAIALLGSVLRQLPLFYEAQNRRAFTRQPTNDLHGKRVGIIGFGGVGKRVAELLAPYRVKMIATDYFPQICPPHVDAVWAADEYPELLRQSDVVILCVPLTPTTQGMIGKEQLASMPAGSVLVNVCRGDVVVESALVNALSDGHLSGAAIDVVCDEPPDADRLIWQAPNLVITPHVAGQSSTRIDRMTDLFCANLHRFQQRLPLINLVDKKIGFPPPNVPKSA
ncbi:MAG: D-2-hydroxyacid dehydrogenase [Planctomycetota bacterium]|nr:D-2-hydroxyacid dehydrogenase [Planctomycetota bacterium]